MNTLNELYYYGLMRSYGNTATGAEDKSKRFKSDFNIEELIIGFDVLLARAGTTSTVTNKTSSTIEVLNRCDRNNVDESGKRRGIDSKNWYTLDDFNKTFKRL
jgi:hypothetical protein